MTTPYENMRLKRMEENKKKLEALNLHTLSQSLNKSSESSSKPSLSVKGRLKFVQPGELEVNKKRLHVVVEYEDEDVVKGDETEYDVAGDEAEDVVVGDEAEDVVVGDETKDVVKVAKSVYWDVKVISK
ncbi:hypothetical protein RYX36_026541 [Vicia faba]